MAWYVEDCRVPLDDFADLFNLINGFSLDFCLFLNRFHRRKWHNKGNQRSVSRFELKRGIDSYLREIGEEPLPDSVVFEGPSKFEILINDLIKKKKERVRR